MMEKSGVLLKGVKYLLSAQDMDRAVSFYRDTIGLKVQQQSPHWSELTFETAAVALHGGGSGQFRRTGLSFTVENVADACTAIVEAGGSVRSGPEDRGDEGIILAEVTDTEGNGIMLSQNK